MRLFYGLLLVCPFGAVAQASEPTHPAAREQAFERLLSYGDAVEAVTAPDSVRESVRFVKWYQQEEAGPCSYTLYVFRPSLATQYFVKKFTSWNDTVVTEAPLVALSPRCSARVDRFFRQAHHLIRTPYSVHLGPSNLVSPKSAPPPHKHPDYGRIDAYQRPPYPPFVSRLYEANAYNTYPRDRSVAFTWRQHRAARTLREALRDFTSCP